MKKESLHEFLNEKRQKNDPGYIRDFILAKPAKKWACHQSDQIVSYQLNQDITPRGRYKVEQYLKDYSIFDTGNGLSTETVVRQNEKTSRFDFQNSGLFRGDVSYIINEHDDILHLDRTIKCYLHLEKKVAPKFTFADKGKIEISVTGGETWNKHTVTRITITVTYPEALRYELCLWDDKTVKPFVDNICKTVLGCDDRLQQAGVSLREIRKYGIPVKGSTYFQDSKKEWVRATSFELHDIKVEKAAGKLFEIPSNYGDLRDYNRNFKKEGKKHYPGPSVPIADVLSPGFTYKPSRPRTDDDQNDNTARGDFAMLARSNELQFPECFPSTFASLVSTDVDQKALDDIRWLANATTKRLTGFSGSGGHIDIDWLAQFATNAAALAGGPGSGLFAIMRDPTNHLGLLDKLAIKNVQQLLAAGTITTDLDFSAQPGLLLNVSTALGLATDQRWDSLNNSDQFALVELYVEQRLAHLKLSYPSSTGWQTVFHDLITFELTDIDFDININNKAVITTLDFDSDSIHLVIGLDDVSGKAWVIRSATALYWGLVAVSWLGCFFVPLLCTLAAALTAVGIFLLMDIAYLSIDLSNLMIDSHIRFVPNGAGVLQPDVSLALTANVNVFYMSVIPDGVHQIIALIITAVANLTSIVLNTIQSQLQDKLNSFVKNDLNLSYPPAFGPVPLAGLSSQSVFAPDDNLYLEAGLNAGLFGITSPFITQVEKDVMQNLLVFRQEFKSSFTDPVAAYNATTLLNWAQKPDFLNIARYYFGSVISQNFLNHYVYTLWRTGDFNYDFTQAEATKIFELIQPYFPEFKRVNPANVHAHLWPATSPRTVLTPYPASQGQYYAATFMDDLRLCIEIGENQKRIKDNRIEFLFSCEAFTELGFGGRVPGKTLDILKVTDRVFDIYFDTKKFIITLIHPEVYSFRMNSITLSSNV
ncbi:MAG TPA: hypothetical protein VG890_15505, partial [Puia sp.]|nr:hypothetical protein [Puia sp.]